MKNLILAAGIIALLALACNKSSDKPAPPDPVPPVPKDTAVSGWTKIAVDTTYLVDIFFETPMVGYTGGDQIFKTNDGGNTWVVADQIKFLSNLFVAPGDHLHTLDNEQAKVRNYANWATQSTLVPLDGGYVGPGDLFFTDTNTGYVTIKNKFFKTEDGGQTWATVTGAAGLVLDQINVTLFFTDSTTGWVVSGKNIYASNGTITQWTKATISSPQPDTLYSIFAASATTIYSGASDGTVLKSTDGGLHFSKVYQFPSAVPGRYHDLHFIDASLGYACYDNRVYKTTDGGGSWTVEVATDGDNIIEIHFLDKNHGWACTRRGKVWKYLVN